MSETVNFYDFAVNDYVQNSGHRKAPEGLSLFFVRHKVAAGSESAVALCSNFQPGWLDRYDTQYRLFQVDGLGLWRLFGGRETAATIASRMFDVYDFNISDLADPTKTGPLNQIQPYHVPIYADAEEREKTRSYVADEHIKNRILEYARGAKVDWRKYIQLRKAPFESDNNPAWGHYNYQGIVAEANESGRQFQRFTQADVEWLNEFMRNSGLEIPQLSN